MDKRGDAEVWELFTLSELILGLMILTFFVVFVMTYTSASNYNKEYLKEDLRQLSSSLLASPSKVTYAYPVNTAYDVSIGENVDVSASSRFAVFKESYTLELSSAPEQALQVRKK